VFRRLLVPHDFSEHSDRALETALGLAKALGAHIVLVHAFQRPLEPYGILPIEPALAEIPEAARQRLQVELDKVLAAGIEGEARVREGRAVDEILAEIEASGADLVVMGTHGLTGFSHAMLGSVAERTVRQAPCAVLTVKGASAS
jgi:nucleotide-binding universal stress UspA family protein